MASEEATESVSINVPPELAGWLRQQADERGVDVETYGRELLVAQRAVDTGALADGDVDAESLAEAEIDDALDDRFEGLRDEFVELLEDVRSRVIQVKRETDAKAPADHEHPELAGELDALHGEVGSLVADVEDHRASLEDLREDLDGGFENFEEILEYLVETTDDLADRADRLGRATIATRERVQELATTVTERKRADDLKRDAALEGITTADCEACDRSIRLSLLTEPRCPACAADFVDLEPKQGLLGSATLLTGDHPALKSGDLDAVTDEIESAIDAERPHPGDVDWESTGDGS